MRTQAEGAGGEEKDRNIQGLINPAISSSIYMHNVVAVYSPEKERTYVTYRRDLEDVVVTFFDHNEKSLQTETKIATYPLDGDNHGPPSMALDDDGILHVFYGSHASPIQYVRSEESHDITSWEYMGATLDESQYPPWQEFRDETEGLSGPSNIGEMPNGTYTIPAVVDNDIYVLYRPAQDNGRAHGSLDNEPEDPAGRTSYPDHEYATIIRSRDGGITWTDLGPVIDVSGFIGQTDHLPEPITGADAYIARFDVGPSDKLHITWRLSVGIGGNPHSDLRKHGFHAVFDPDTETLSSINGEELGDRVTADQMTGPVRVFEGEYSGGEDHHITDDTVYVLSKGFDRDESTIHWYVSEFVDGEWVTSKIPGAVTNHSGNGGAIRVNENGNLEAHLITGDGSAVGFVSAEPPLDIETGGNRGGDYTCFERVDGAWESVTLVEERMVDGNERQPWNAYAIRNGSDEFSVLTAEVNRGSLANTLYATGSLFD
jgi:hypothetical protein